MVCPSQIYSMSAVEVRIWSLFTQCDSVWSLVLKVHKVEREEPRRNIVKLLLVSLTSFTNPKVEHSTSCKKAQWRDRFNEHKQQKTLYIKSIHYLSPLLLCRVAGGWSLYQLTLGERRGTPWTLKCGQRRNQKNKIRKHHIEINNCNYKRT